MRKYMWRYSKLRYLVKGYLVWFDELTGFREDSHEQIR